MATGAVTAALVALVGLRSRIQSPAASIRDLLMLTLAMAASARMISVPDSHALSLAIGRSATWSGLYLGITKWGDMVGNVACAVPLHILPNYWQDHGRQATICALTIMASASSFGTLLLFWAARGLGDDLAGLLCASRALIGFGNGIVTQLVMVLLTRLTPQEDMPKEFQRALFSLIVGTSFGPLAAAAGYSLDFCPRPPGIVPRFEIVGVVQVILLLGPLLAVVLFYPLIRNEDIQVAEVAKKEVVCDRILILSGLLLCLLGALVAGSVEVSTPLLLEREFGWSIASTGLITGLAFLPAFPVRMAQQSLGDRLSDVAWIRLFGLAAALGACLLSSVASKLLPQGFALVLGDMIIFPSIYLGEGLTQGMMMQHVPHGGPSLLFNVNTIALATDIVVNACQGLGPVMARTIIAAGGPWGQDLNAISELVCCAAFLAIFELGMNRGASPSEQGQKASPS